MTYIKHIAFALAVSFYALLMSAQAQTPRVNTVNITAESGKVHISAQGDVTEIRIEVFDEAGDVVFESGAISGNTLDWKMQDTQGERVAAGTYLVTVTFRNAAGKLRKRVEQVTITEDEKASTQVAASSAPNVVQADITGSGTSGKLAKFTGGSAIGNSVITESAGKIGIGTAAPAAMLAVVGAIANNPALSTENNATGGIGLKGTSSNTTGIGILGTHTATGGTTPGVKGETNSTVYGAVGVLGVVNPTNAGSFSAGVRGTNKSTSSNGVGVYGEHEGEGYGVFGASHGTGVFGNGDERGVYGLSSVGTGVEGYSTSSKGVVGHSRDGSGVFGESTNGIGVHGEGFKIYGVFGESSTGRGVYGVSASSHGVSGYSTSGYGIFGRGGNSTSYAGYFEGRVRITTNLFVTGDCFGCDPPSDRHLKANFSTVNPRLILDRLATIPIQSWNYKSEPETVRHIGVMAQDFRTAFNLGTDDKTLHTVDAQGVTMAAIQGLYQQNQELALEISTLKTELQKLKRTVKQQRRRRR
jgi:hypothetical protein